METLGPDGFITMEFALMELYARDAARNGAPYKYWCDIPTRDYLKCLDIASPSTLANSLNTTNVLLYHENVFSNPFLLGQVFDNIITESTNLFGNLDACDANSSLAGGDNVINSFDIGVMLSYVFAEGQYSTLSQNPSQVPTVTARGTAPSLCGSNFTTSSWFDLISTDPCARTTSPCWGEFLGTGGCTGGTTTAHDGVDPNLPVENLRRICADICAAVDCDAFQFSQGIAGCETILGECILDDSGDPNVQVYQPTIACSHAFRPSPPPPPPALPPSIPARRLSERITPTVGAIGAVVSVQGRQWVTHPLQIIPSVASGKYMAHAEHFLYLDQAHASGTWYTLRTGSVAIHLQVSLFDQRTTYKMSNRAFDGTEPEDVNVGEVRFTRFCEFLHCDQTCASINPPFPDRIFEGGNIELSQTPYTKACHYELHVWIPGHKSCVGLNHIVIADGIKGQYARGTYCAREVQPGFPPPPPLPLYPLLSPTVSPPHAPPSVTRAPAMRTQLWVATGFIVAVSLSCATFLYFKHIQTLVWTFFKTL